MAIVSVHKLNQRGEDGTGFENKGTYEDSFEVITDSADDRQSAVGAILNADDGSESIPQIGDEHPDDSDALCFKRTAEQTEDNPYRWTVNVSYNAESTANPLNALATVRWDAREFKRPITVDVADPPVDVLTAAGAPFDPTPEVDDADMTLVIQRNERTFDPVDRMTYRYTLPTRTFYGFAAVQCRMRPITATRKTDPFTYYEVTYTIDFCDRRDEDGNQKGWTLRVLNAGHFELVGGARRAITPDGQPGGGPVLLATDGTRLAVGGTPNYLEFEGYRQRDWDSLGLEGV